MKKSLFVAITVLALSMLVAAPALAESMTMCDTPTIPALAECVSHHVSNQGVAQSLLAKLDAAQAAQLRGDTGAAINLLNAFISEVQAQSGKFVPAEHAAHIIMHAQNVIAALAG